MTRRHSIILAAGLLLALLASRLCYLRVVWTEEAYPAAAAIQMLDGKALYRDVWYDKPPLAAAVYLLWDAKNGLPLRIAGALFMWFACLAAWRFARELWGPHEGVAAASLLTFFFIFDIPSSAVVLGPDLLMLLPHAMAVWLAWRGNAFASGVAAGVAFLFNTKAAFVVIACLLFCPQGSAFFLAGFLAPNLIAAGILYWQGALAAYWQQVWEWGFMYARDSPLEHPWLNGLERTLNWAGFHAALVIGATVFFVQERLRKYWPFAAWAVLSLAAVAGGWRFFPRYYFQLLPVAVLLGARGFALLGRTRVLLVLLLAIPFMRFGPRYVTLANDLRLGRETQWGDLNMSQDAEKAARLIERLARPGDSLLVWGYRPEIFAYTRMPAGTRFLDSQPLTGVIADRHLTVSKASAPELAALSRASLAKTEPSPTFVLDGLGPYNHSLAVTEYPDLRAWLSHYRQVAQTSGTVIYQLR